MNRNDMYIHEFCKNMQEFYAFCLKIGLLVLNKRNKCHNVMNIRRLDELGNTNEYEHNANSKTNSQNIT